MKNLISILTHIFLLRPLLTFMALVIVIGISIHQSFHLSIDSNQIDLLPKDSTEIVKSKEVIEMIGGNGFYTIALKVKDEKGRDKHILSAIDAKKKGNLALFKSEMATAEKIKQDNLEYYKKNEHKIKRYADKLYTELIKDKDIRYISHKYDTSFIKENLPLFINPQDMREARNRIKHKIDNEIQKLNPLNNNETSTEYNLNFDDLLLKYHRLANRNVFDAYNISLDKEMLLLLIKPEGSLLDFTRNLENKIKKIVSNLRLEEKGIHVAYSGSYKINLDDYDSLVDALKPISIASLVGIIILLFIFFRNPIFIIILVISLLSGIAITFGITGIVIGKLNTVTTIMAAVLMGLGIDYGIQFLYRFREEFTLRDDFMIAVTETVFHTGLASLITAFTTTSAFVVLMFSDYKGFSEFGIIACYGLLIIALCMYFVTSLQIAILFRFFPSTKHYFYTNQNEKEDSNLAHRFFENPKLVLRISLFIIVAISLFAPMVQFNYSGRDLLLENQESLLVYDEISDRFNISSDPQAIVTDTLEKSEAVFDFFSPVPEKMKDSVDQVGSLWNVVPPENQQKENIHILNQIKKDLKNSKPSMLTEEQKQYLPIVEKYLSLKDFSIADVPPIFKDQFKEVQTSKVKGNLVFIYSKVSLWQGNDLLHFYQNVGKFDYPLISKRTLNAILYSTDIDLDKNSENHALGKFTSEEEATIVKIANSASKSELEGMKILPLTAQLIIDKRPFNSITEMRAIKETAYTTGSLIIFAKLAMIVQREAYPAVGITLLFVLIILIIFYRGFLPAILSLFPLVVGLLVMLGIMGIFGIKINYINILVFPIIIGYGIQNGIYIYYRFMEERNIGRAVTKVGPAIIASTLTTLVGWIVLLIAEHRGLHSLGVIASIGVGSSLLVALTLLPSLLAIAYSPKKEDSSDLSDNLNLTIIENSDPNPIDLDSEESDSPDEKIEIKIRNVSINYKEDLKEKPESMKEEPTIDLDKIKEEEVPATIETPVKIDLNLKEDLKEKLKSMKEEPTIDLDKIKEEEKSILEEPNANLNITDDLRKKRKTSSKKISTSKKTSNKIEDTKDLSVEVPKKKKTTTKKTTRTKKKE